VKIPAAVVDNTPTPFPVGVYIGELADVEDRGQEGETEFLRLNFVNNTPADDNTESPGNRIFREDVCLRHKGISLFDYEEVTEAMPFLLKRGAFLLSSFALAIGATSRVAEGAVELDLPSFVHDLREGEYSGFSALFQVEHNTYKPKDADENDAPRTNAQVRRFASAD